MTDTDDGPTDTHDWRLAHEAARELHDALLAIGVPESELTAITARQDSHGIVRVAIPALTVASIRRTLTALGPALGPHFIGRRDASPIAPGRPA